METEELECLICYNNRELFPVCRTTNCDGNRIGLCKQCINRQRRGRTMTCPMCRSEYTLEFDICDFCEIM